MHACLICLSLLAVSSKSQKFLQLIQGMSGSMLKCLSNELMSNISTLIVALDT